MLDQVGYQYTLLEAEDDLAQSHTGLNGTLKDHHSGNQGGSSRR